MMKEKKNNRILVATKNRGKLREFEKLFENQPFEFVSLNEFPEIEDVEETGATFEENADLKASTYARQAEMWAIADDSGLEVDALDGAPGVFSARYAGEGASDAQKIEKLLKELEKSGASEKKARFVCVISFADPKGEIIHREIARCEGRIADKPSGDNGFGYDPVFLPDGFDATFGELAVDIKQQISHRAQATRQIQRFLLSFFQDFS